MEKLLLQSGDNLRLPDNYLDKTTVEEQLKILRELKRPAKETWQKLKNGSKRETGFAEKMRKNTPYNVFFTVIPDSPVTDKQKNSIKLTGI